MAEGLAELERVFSVVKEAARANLAEVVNKGADMFVEAAQAAAPVSDLEQHAGQLRDATHKKATDNPLKVYVVNDAKDAKGHFIGIHVEAGHKAVDGTHVPAVPWFYPAWRLMRPKIKSMFRRAINAAAKGQVSDGQ